MTISVSEIVIYPVKSLRGISLQQCRLTCRGLEHDRRFMVVRGNGKFVTQRDQSVLALIDTQLEEDGVLLSRPGHGSFKLLFDAPAGARIDSKVWGDPVETSDMGDAASVWLTRATGSTNELRLVRMAEGFTRQETSASRFGEANATFFADASPYLLANLASLDALNTELKSRNHASVPMNRFRANIVVDGLAAFEEHQTDRLSAEHYAFRLCEPCERCVVPTIDQATGLRDPAKEPFKTLVDINPMPGKRTPAFAENALLEHGEGEIIALGDSLRPISVKRRTGID